MGRHSRGGTCPRCGGYAGFSVRGGDDPVVLTHRTPQPFNRPCPTYGLAFSLIKAGWTAISWRTYNWLLGQGRAEEAAAYRAEREIRN